jgi:ABC-type bacteriocin/lantibiotic exporter with double-glycine peptidase domain
MFVQFLVALLFAFGITVDGSDCGPYSAFIAASRFEHQDTAFSEFKASLGAKSASGYSLSQLANGVESLGLHALAVKTSIANLRTRKELQDFTAVLHINDNHYVIADNLGSEFVMIRDFPKRYEMGTDELKAVWNQNHALLISNVPLIPEEDLGRRTWLATAVFLTLILGVLMTGVYFARSRYRRSLQTS